MERTQWIIGGISILEPMTAITDFLVTAVCVIAFVKLRRISRQNGNYLSIYPYFFLTMGLGCLMAGIMTHALAYTFVPELLSKAQMQALPWADKMAYHLHDLPNWLLNITSVTLFMLSMAQRANDVLTIRYRANLMVIWGESLAVLTLLITYLTYDIATAHIGFSLYAIELPLMLRLFRSYNIREARQEAMYLISGTLLMIISVPVMAGKMQISPWFNHNDISHCLIAITMYLFYKSAEICLANRNYEK